MFTGAPGWMELLIVAFVILLLFGKRLPGAMNSVGKSIVEFKKGMSDTGESDNESFEKRDEQS